MGLSLSLVRQISMQKHRIKQNIYMPTTSTDKKKNLKKFDEA